ncbi:VIT family protein [Streptomyces sp. NPDC088106]|uniref:VIT1/CCC1 transporter family protein n=2 Tax=Streptomyces TaxID=1883 RepID=UPI00341DCF81
MAAGVGTTAGNEVGGMDDRPMGEEALGEDALEGSQSARISRRLNWLRAGVMGANDGIVSTAALVVGVAGAAVSNSALLASGVAAVAAGALSMAVGEYVSVSSQRDSQVAELALERSQLQADPAGELDQLTGMIQARGIDADLARPVAVQLTKKDALTAHARLELGIDPDELINPWHAGLSSMLTFIIGGLVPLLAILLAPRSIAVGVTVVAVVLALGATGSISAHLGGASKLRAVTRVVIGGLGAMVVTYAIGLLVGTQI